MTNENRRDLEITSTGGIRPSTPEAAIIIACALEQTPRQSGVVEAVQEVANEVRRQCIARSFPSPIDSIELPASFRAATPRSDSTGQVDGLSTQATPIIDSETTAIIQQWRDDYYQAQIHPTAFNRQEWPVVVSALDDYAVNPETPLDRKQIDEIFGPLASKMGLYL